MNFKTFTELEKEINRRASIAVKNTAIIVCEKLRECIDEQYYRDPEFYPNVYERTFQFLNSATYEILGSNMAKVKVDTNGMHYKTGFPGETVVQLASESMHGSARYQTNTKPFWDTFIEWGNTEIIPLLKKELASQGLNVK